MSTILIALLILFILGALPATGWHSFGYAPSTIGTFVLFVLVILLLTGIL